MKVEPFYVGFGLRMARARKARDLSQAELGKLLDPPTTRACVSNIESAKQRVLAHTVVQLARALRVSVVELMGGAT